MGKMILNGKEYAGSGSEWHEYSTDEKVVGKWIDGKPIYEKTINISNPSTGENTYTHGISNFDKLIGYKGNAYRSNGDMFNVPSPHPQIEWLISYFDFNSTSYKQYIGSNFINTYAITEINLILRYTKTTD